MTITHVEFSAAQFLVRMTKSASLGCAAAALGLFHIKFTDMMRERGSDWKERSKAGQQVLAHYKLILLLGGSAGAGLEILKLAFRVNQSRRSIIK